MNADIYRMFNLGEKAESPVFPYAMETQTKELQSCSYEELPALEEAGFVLKYEASLLDAYSEFVPEIKNFCEEETCTDIRTRLASFEEDWNAPGMEAYDEM